jgi:hypothetical protein
MAKEEMTREQKDLLENILREMFSDLTKEV